MAHWLSNGHVTDDVTWPPKVSWGSTVGYPSDSLASCSMIHPSDGQTDARYSIMLSRVKIHCSFWSYVQSLLTCSIKMTSCIVIVQTVNECYIRLYSPLYNHYHRSSSDGVDSRRPLRQSVMSTLASLGPRVGNVEEERTVPSQICCNCKDCVTLCPLYSDCGRTLGLQQPMPTE